MKCGRYCCLPPQPAGYSALSRRRWRCWPGFRAGPSARRVSCAGSAKSPEPPAGLLGALPPECRDFLDVFEQKRAETLTITPTTPHRVYDCSIELFPDAPLPSGHIYPLSQPEMVALKAYTEDGLDWVFIQYSTSLPWCHYNFCKEGWKLEATCGVSGIE